MPSASDVDAKPYLPLYLIDLLVRVERGDSYRQIAAATYWSEEGIRARAAATRTALAATTTIAAARRARTLGLLPEDQHGQP